MMFAHEWYKLWHNRKLVGFLFALLALNSLYFWYHAEKKSVPAHAYRELTADICNLEDAEALETLSGMKQELNAVLYMETGNIGSVDYPKYCDNLFLEGELYSLKMGEYEDAINYKAFVEKAVGAAAEYRVILKMLGGSGKKLADVEKTSRSYEALEDVSIHNTHTKGISEALSLPSLIFLEILMAVLFVSVVFTREKEQGLLRLYSSMKAGRGRMFLARIGAIVLGCAVSNFLFLFSTLTMGCFLYGLPGLSFLTEPLQALSGYKQAVLRVNIATFLVLVYLWSVIVSLAVAMLAAMINAVVSSAMKVYVILFAFIGIEGILYLKIDDLSYLAPWKRINLISWANPGYTIAQYRNEFVFGSPVSYPVVALCGLALMIAVFGAFGWLLSEKGYGVIHKKGRGLGLHLKGHSEERSFGQHTKLFLHENTKFLRFEKIGWILIAVLGIVLLMTKPYQKYYASVTEMFYQSYLYRLNQVEPEQYDELIADFGNELEQERMTTSDQSSLMYKESAFSLIRQYVDYLQSKQGARTVDSRGYEKLYNDRKQNVILGVCAILTAIFCGAAMMATEYRTGMAGQIRISPQRGKVYLWKGIILLGAVTAFFLLIYGRYLYQVLRGYGTEGIGFQANSMMDWAKYPPSVTIAGGIVILLLKRFLGMLLCTAVAVFLTSRLKSFLLTAIVCIVALAVPLLLCLKETGALSYVMVNRFFL